MIEAPIVFDALGTRWQIDVPEIDKEQREILTKTILERLETFDRAYSRFRPDSLITAMATSPGTYRLPDDAKPLFDVYEKLYNLTNGAFTPLIGQTLVDAGYDAAYSLKPGPLSSLPAWDEVIDYQFPTLQMKQPWWLDLGAAGKGYAVDLVAHLVQQTTAGRFCVDAGGDMIVRADKETPWRIGLEDPNDPTKAIGEVQLTSGSICGSAGNRRRWATFHHIINPKTLSSPDHLAAVWVVAPTALLADALTTCLYFTSPDVLQRHFTFEYLLLTPDSRVTVSPGFPGTLYT